MSCPLCLTPFVGDEVTLSCGQTICGNCVESLLLGGDSFDCPFCMETHVCSLLVQF